MDIKPEQLKIVCDILSHHLPCREVQIFGSRAIATSKQFSDLDLVIMGDDALSVTTLRKLRDAFDDSDLPFQVDLVEWAGTSEEFRKVIVATVRPLELYLSNICEEGR